MLKTYLYIPDDLNEKINRAAKDQNQSKAEIIRKALENGIKTQKKPIPGGAQTLLKLAEIGKKYKLKGPRDLSKNMDKYLWEDYEP